MIAYVHAGVGRRWSLVRDMSFCCARTLSDVALSSWKFFKGYDDFLWYLHQERAYQRRVGKHTKTFRVNLDRPVEIQRELESLGGIMKNVKYPAVVLLTEDSRVGDIAVTYGFMPANPIRKQD